MFVDTHCHLDFPEFDHDRKEVVQRAAAAGVNYIINIGSSLAGSRRSVELAGRFANIYSSVGIHPHEADGFNREQETALRQLCKEEKVVAIGEAGLDYFKNYSVPAKQKILFAFSIGLAREMNLPLVIHSRQAQDDTLRMLEERLPLRAVVHCFSGDEYFLERCLGSGFFISFTCNITYPAKLSNCGRDPAAGNSAHRDKKAEGLRNLVRLTPMDRLMLETDAPYLPPEGLRGRRNEPSFVAKLAEEVARIKGLDLKAMAEATTANAKSFFKLQ
ncbi:MAG: TatD family hydrolase [Candidatus Omnitrophota bacterium]|nr:TatD family hydrolase [Candidatus Omnitrophota bacterium]